jgi:hypothetical protein
MTTRLLMNTKSLMFASLTAGAGAFLLTACDTGRGTPVSPTTVGAATMAVHSSGHDDHGYIDGWFEGDDVNLHYTKSFFCAEPPASGADSNCVIGAAPEVEPRPGPIPVIYAIAAVGFTPDPSTVACLQGTPCLNHPAMIDASRIGGRANGQALSHSHIISEHRGGWFRTVNIRIFNVNVWNQIAQAKTLEKVRELQANPAVGGAGLISQDTATNIFFFIASFQKGKD